MEDMNNMPFKNAAISRLTGQTTTPARIIRKADRAWNKVDKAQDKLEKYVNSSKAPYSTKEKYNDAKQYLGGYYDGKPLGRMTDVNYNDMKALKIKSKSDKGQAKYSKIEDKAVDRLRKIKAKKG